MLMQEVQVSIRSTLKDQLPSRGLRPIEVLFLYVVRLPKNVYEYGVLIRLNSIRLFHSKEKNQSILSKQIQY